MDWPDWGWAMSSRTDLGVREGQAWKQKDQCEGCAVDQTRDVVGLNQVGGRVLKEMSGSGIDLEGRPNKDFSWL